MSLGKGDPSRPRPSESTVVPTSECLTVTGDDLSGT